MPKNKKFFYRVVSRNLGAKCLLTPNPSKDYIFSGEKWECPPPRICIAPTIPQCVFALPYDVLNSKNKLYVYRTYTNDYHRKNVKNFEGDAKLTGEVWLLKSHWFQMVASFPPDLNALFKEFLYADNSGVVDNYLSDDDRVEYNKIRLKGIRKIVKDHIQRLPMHKRRHATLVA